MDESIIILLFAIFNLVFFKVTVVVFPSLLIDAAAFTGADKSITIRTYGTGASVLVTKRASCKLAAFAWLNNSGRAMRKAKQIRNSLRNTFTPI